MCGAVEFITLAGSTSRSVASSSLRSSRATTGILLMFFFTTVQARCRHCFGVGAPGCDGTADTCPLHALPISGAGLISSFATVTGFLRLHTRIDPPAVNVQVTMQVLGTIIRTGRLCLFDWSGICTSRLMRFTRAHPVEATATIPAARACAYVEGARWPVQGCRKREYASFCSDESKGGHELDEVDTPPHRCLDASVA